MLAALDFKFSAFLWVLRMEMIATSDQAISDLSSLMVEEVVLDFLFWKTDDSFALSLSSVLATDSYVIV